jgi:hypothetical protein
MMQVAYIAILVRYQEGKPLAMRNTYALRKKIKTLTRFTEKTTKY